MDNNNEWLWFEGVVEDRNDPLMLGRVRVRVIGLNTVDKSEIPTEHLPWAQVIHPVTSAANNGIGHTPAMTPGSHVVGFFRDGMACQDPIIWGAVGGIPQETSDPDNGFSDPNGLYPKEDWIDEPDTSRLARRENLAQTAISTKNNNRVTGVSTANGGSSWNMPESAYNAQYPFNHVYESESGHVKEYDDTEGSERVHEFHRSGTFYEWDANGTEVKQIVGDRYEVLERHGKLYIKGNADVTVDGSKSLHVKNAAEIQISGDCNATFENNLNAQVYGNLSTGVEGTADIAAKGTLNMKSDGRLVLTSAGGIDLMTMGTLNIAASGVINEQGSLISMNGGGTSPSHSSVGNIGSPASTSSPQFSTLPSTGLSEDLHNDHDTPDNPPTQEYYTTLENLGLDQPSSADNDPETKASETEEKDAEKTTPTSCSMFENTTRIPETAQLSNHYKLRDVSSAAVVTHNKLTAQADLSKAQIACNLKGVTESCADPIKNEYPDMIITSGFRFGNGDSQHHLGQAVDMQFQNASPEDYYDIARWIRDNVTFDQLILEGKNTGTQLPWIHVSFRSSGVQRNNYFTMFNHRVVSSNNEFKQLYPI